MYLSLSVYTYIYIYICPVVQADRRDRHGAAEEAPGARGGLSSSSDYYYYCCYYHYIYIYIYVYIDLTYLYTIIIISIIKPRPLTTAPGARGGLSSTSIHIPSHILWYGNGSSSVTCTLTIYFMVYYGELTMVHCNTPGDRGGLSSSSSMVIVIVQW